MQIYTHQNRRIVQHSNTHYDIEELRPVLDKNGQAIYFVWAVIDCENEDDMNDLRFTPAVLVTGEDERGNEFCWYYANEKFVDGYNVAEITATQFRAIYPQVYKVYFSDTVMSGDQWRAMQCPLSLSNVQIEEWRKRQERQHEDDCMVWQIEFSAASGNGFPEPEETACTCGACNQHPAVTAYELDKAMDADCAAKDERLDTGLTDDQPYRPASFDADANVIPF